MAKFIKLPNTVIINVDNVIEIRNDPKHARVMMIDGTYYYLDLNDADSATAFNKIAGYCTTNSL